MNAPARGWRPGDEPPSGWERDPSDSRDHRTFRGEVSPGALVRIEFHTQRPFIWEGVSAAQPHALSYPAVKGVPATEGAGDELEASASAGPETIATAARGPNWMSLSAWFLCHENGAPALNWERIGHVIQPGQWCVLELRNKGERAHSYAVTFQGLEATHREHDARGAHGAP
jgi:hypothetical protein